MIKHFSKVIKMSFISLTCRHKETDSASCPVTGKTYTRCVRCWKRTSVVNTADIPSDWQYHA